MYKMGVIMGLFPVLEIKGLQSASHLACELSSHLGLDQSHWSVSNAILITYSIFLVLTIQWKFAHITTKSLSYQVLLRKIMFYLTFSRITDRLSLFTQRLPLQDTRCALINYQQGENQKDKCYMYKPCDCSSQWEERPKEGARQICPRYTTCVKGLLSMFPFYKCILPQSYENQIKVSMQ